jgi:hypothetical protein
MGAAILSVLGGGLRQFDLRTVAAIVLAILLPLGGYAWGHRDAAEACRARAFAGALASAEQNIESLNAAAVDTATRTTKLEALNGDLRAKVTDYEKQLANPVAPAPAVCRLSDDDARRLRELGPGDAARRP